MSCTNICHNFKVKKPEIVILRYEIGQKYCSHCAVFMRIDENRCPCRKYQLKVKSTKYRNETKIKRI